MQKYKSRASAEHCRRLCESLGITTPSATILRSLMVLDSDYERRQLLRESCPGRYRPAQRSRFRFAPANREEFLQRIRTR